MAFANGIKTAIAVYKNAGVEEYSFPASTSKGFFFDLTHTLDNRFVAEAHKSTTTSLTGWIDSRTTCNVGTYRVYYAIR